MPDPQLICMPSFETAGRVFLWLNLGSGTVFSEKDDRCQAYGRHTDLVWAGETTANLPLKSREIWWNSITLLFDHKQSHLLKYTTKLRGLKCYYVDHRTLQIAILIDFPSCCGLL